MIVRHADDFALGFQHRSDTERFTRALAEAIRGDDGVGAPDGDHVLHSALYMKSPSPVNARGARPIRPMVTAHRCGM